jgi:TolB-like protein/DNA-binding winged helix-turn-helix (wHTH) protein/Flp pilus assembly protein TadD
MSASKFRFGLFELDVEPPELRRGGARVSLQQLPLRLLGALVERPGELVLREELRERLWPADVHVDFDNSLNAAMSRLREALGDSATNPRFIATEPRRGFRFIAPVEPVPYDEKRAGAFSPVPERRRRLTFPTALAIMVVALTAVLVALWLSLEPGPKTPGPGKTLLAVLPFEDLSPSPDRGYLSEGLTEELIGRLGSASPRRLGVVARSSVMRYRGHPIDEVAKQLDVQYVVEGSVRHEGESVRVSVRLITTGDRATLWSQSYDASFANALALQADIAGRVAESLESELLDPASPLGAPASPRAARVQELYLKGRYLLNRQTPNALMGALSAFEEATALAPQDAGAFGGLAETYLALGRQDVWPTARAFPKAAEAARMALRLDPGSLEVRLVVAEGLFYMEHDFARAEEMLVEVVRRNPSLSRAQDIYARLLTATGRYDEAVARTREALRLDPLSLVTGADLCWTHFAARQYERAVAQCRATLELDPHFLPAQDDLKWILIQMGREEEAAEAFLRVVTLEGDPADSVVRLRRLFAEEGLEGLQRASLEALLSRAETQYQAPYDIALEYVVLGNPDAAFEWLGRSIDANETDVVWLGVDPRLDPLRSDERFAHLLDRARLAGP